MKEDITEIDDPEVVAEVFFNALYNEKDVEKAASICSPKLARILLHYKSPQSVARHLFNMSFDTVKIMPDISSIKVREQFEGNTQVILYFDGMYNGERLKDVKRVELIQSKKGWVLDKVLKDPF